MATFWWTWVGLSALLITLVVVLGLLLGKSVWWVFIDHRQTWSLSQFQIVLWTLVGVPLIIATAAWRTTQEAATAWDFSIPGELLALMGITLGTSVGALVIKTTKDNIRGNKIGIREEGQATFADMFSVEEGEGARKNLDVTKVQSFMISMSLLASYVWMVIASFRDLSGDTVPDALPVFSPAMVGLLAFSHGGYLVAKIPNRGGSPAADPVPGTTGMAGRAVLAGAPAG
jgi:hypothetical protein